MYITRLKVWTTHPTLRQTNISPLAAHQGYGGGTERWTKDRRLLSLLIDSSRQSVLLIDSHWRTEPSFIYVFEYRIAEIPVGGSWLAQVVLAESIALRISFCNTTTPIEVKPGHCCRMSSLWEQRQEVITLHQLLAGFVFLSHPPTHPVFVMGPPLGGWYPREQNLGGTPPLLNRTIFIF